MPRCAIMRGVLCGYGRSASYTCWICNKPQISASATSAILLDANLHGAQRLHLGSVSRSHSVQVLDRMATQTSFGDAEKVAHQEHASR